MEPEVIRMYSSSPPPMDDGPEEEEEDSEFGDFGTFSALPTSISLTELDTPMTFNQTQALNATSPPELLNSRGVLGFSHNSSNGTQCKEPLKANGVVPAGRRGDVPLDRNETKSVLTGSRVHPESDPGSRGPEALTNGFVTSDLQGSSAQPQCTGASVEDLDSVRPESPGDDFADFASFSDAEGHVVPAERRASTEDALRDTNRTRTPEPESLSPPAEDSCDTGRGPGPPGDTAFAHEQSASVCTNTPATLNGLDADGQSEPSSGATGDTERVHGKSSDTETETETSLGRPLSMDALEEYGDMSTTGSMASPPIQGGAATPADHSQLVEDDEDDEDDEDFGDFGDVASFGAPGFTDFEQDAEQDGSRSPGSAPRQEPTEDGDEDGDEDDFGDFNSPKFQSTDDPGTFSEFPVSDSFGNFSSAADGHEANTGWSAFGEEQGGGEGEGGGQSWAVFGTGQNISESREEEEEEEHRGGAAAARGDDIRTDRPMVSPHAAVVALVLTGSNRSDWFRLVRLMVKTIS